VIKRAQLPALALALALLLSGCGAIKTQTYTFAMGPRGSDFYAMGEGICQVLTEGVPGARFNPLESGGSAANAELLSDGSAHIAMMTADAARKAAAENAKLRAIAPLFQQALHIVATGSSGIRSLEDLKAKRVSLGTEESGTARWAEAVVNAAGLELRDIQRQYLEPGEAFEQMQNGRLDACFVLAAPGSAAIASLAQEMDIAIVPLNEDAVRELETDGAFSEGLIPADCYEGQGEAVRTAFVDALVVTTADLPESVAKAMASVLRNKAAETLKKSGISLLSEGEAGIPLHEGLVTEQSDE